MISIRFFAGRSIGGAPLVDASGVVEVADTALTAGS
jgi:hypothetical protein